MCVTGDVQQVEGAEKITVKIFKSISLVHEAGMVQLEVRHTPLPTARHSCVQAFKHAHTNCCYRLER